MTILESTAGAASHGPGDAKGYDPAKRSGWDNHPPRMGFFTDTSICIGCKACEVACKEWNSVPEDGLNLLGMSYDNTGSLGASTWRHVAFIEQPKQLGHQEPGLDALPVGPSSIPEVNAEVAAAVQQLPDPTRMGTAPVDLGLPMPAPPGANGSADGRTEFGTVVVQQDICNGCGYCVPACPYGVIDKREEDGRAFKCTLCYDRISDGQMPACAKACPTQSIQYGPVDELRERAAARLEQLQGAGVSDAQLYGESPDDGVGGAGAMFLLLDKPEVYGFPPDPVVPTRDVAGLWKRAGIAGVALIAGVAVMFVGRRP